MTYSFKNHSIELVLMLTLSGQWEVLVMTFSSCTRSPEKGFAVIEGCKHRMKMTSTKGKVTLTAFVEIKNEDAGGVTGVLGGLCKGAAQVSGLSQLHFAKDDQDRVPEGFTCYTFPTHGPPE